MSQQETQQTRQQLRRTVRKTAERHDSVTVSEVVRGVSTDTGTKQADVVDVLDELERHGFIYLVGDGCPRGEQEVCVP